MASHNVVLLPGPLSALHAYLRAFVSSVVLLTVMGRQAKPFLPSSLCLSCLALLVRPFVLLVLPRCLVILSSRSLDYSAHFANFVLRTFVLLFGLSCRIL